jgi:hypothetical protein
MEKFDMANFSMFLKSLGGAMGGKKRGWDVVVMSNNFFPLLSCPKLISRLLSKLDKPRIF